MAKTIYYKSQMTGGISGALDSVSVANLLSSDISYVFQESAETLLGFYFASTATMAENTSTHPYRVRPDDYSTAGVWKEVDVGTDPFTTDITIAGSDPYFESTNTTQEDTNGGRETELIFKGYQSGGEVTTLGNIIFSHSGTSDDEKGQIDINLNHSANGATPSINILSASPSSIVFNASLSTIDFVINGTSANSFYVSSAGKIGFGTNSPDELVHLVSSASSKPILLIENQNDDASPGFLLFYKNGTSPADDDNIGQINFQGDDSAGNKTSYAYIQGFSPDVTHTDEAGGISFNLRMNNLPKDYLVMSAYNGAVNEGTITFNGGEQDVDFRVAASGLATAFFIQGSDGGVFATNLKSGASQASAGAALNEVWRCASHATLPDGVMILGS